MYSTGMVLSLRQRDAHETGLQAAAGRPRRGLATVSHSTAMYSRGMVLSKGRGMHMKPAKKECFASYPGR